MCICIYTYVYLYIYIYANIYIYHRDDLLSNQNDLQHKIENMELENLRLKKKVHTDEIQLDFYKNQVFMYIDLFVCEFIYICIYTYTYAYA
jgi:hypothetical protein